MPGRRTQGRVECAASRQSSSPLSPEPRLPAGWPRPPSQQLQRLLALSPWPHWTSALSPFRTQRPTFSFFSPPPPLVFAPRLRAFASSLPSTLSFQWRGKGMSRQSSVSREFLQRVPQQYQSSSLLKYTYSAFSSAVLFTAIQISSVREPIQEPIGHSRSSFHGLLFSILPSCGQVESQHVIALLPRQAVAECTH